MQDGRVQGPLIALDLSETKRRRKLTAMLQLGESKRGEALETLTGRANSAMRAKPIISPH